ncbi:hypothetical protein BJX68DRAFT_213832 [Aspergillus pseudodeflectus]|uniref:Uncharacterized protein n=1 Tax=Aspergillus pseudodeflectus TaxID=176178 RepID=A0ABR4JEF1_9EURO
MLRGLAGRSRHGQIQINAIAPCIVGKYSHDRCMRSTTSGFVNTCPETNIGARLGKLPGIIFTPLKAVTRAVEMLLSNPELNGKIAEISEDRITFAEPPGVCGREHEEQTWHSWNPRRANLGWWVWEWRWKNSCGCCKGY